MPFKLIKAKTTAVKLAGQGVKALELYAGFGNEGLVRISKAVNGKAAVGAVRFDFKSGDEIFQ